MREGHSRPELHISGGWEARHRGGIPARDTPSKRTPQGPTSSWIPPNHIFSYEHLWIASLMSDIPMIQHLSRIHLIKSRWQSQLTISPSGVPKIHIELCSVPAQNSLAAHEFFVLASCTASPTDLASAHLWCSPPTPTICSVCTAVLDSLWYQTLPCSLLLVLGLSQTDAQSCSWPDPSWHRGLPNTTLPERDPVNYIYVVPFYFIVICTLCIGLISNLINKIETSSRLLHS